MSAHFVNHGAAQERPDSAGSTAPPGLPSELKGSSMSNSNIRRCVELRKCMKPLGDQLDALDAIRAANGGRWSDEQSARYREIDADYDRLFDQLCDEPLCA